MGTRPGAEESLRRYILGRLTTLQPRHSRAQSIQSLSRYQPMRAETAGWRKDQKGRG